MHTDLVSDLNIRKPKERFIFSALIWSAMTVNRTPDSEGLSNQHENEPIQDNIRFPSTEFYDYYIENHKTIRQETNTTDVKNFIGRVFLIL